MRTTPTRPKGTLQHRKIVKSLNSIECSFWGKASDSIEFLQCQTAAQPLPDPRQSHYIVQSASQPNHCPIHISCIMSLRVHPGQTVAQSTSAVCCCSQCVPHQIGNWSMSAACCHSQSAPHKIGIWSTLATWCCSQSVSWPNRDPIHVSCILLLTECTPPNCYLIYVSRMLLLTERILPNRYLIYISRMMLLAECISAKLLPDPYQPYNVV